jgi:hypothetical protein
MGLADVKLGITANNSNAGGTLSMVFYRDAAATGISAEYLVSKNSVLVSGFNGVRQGYTNMGNATNGSSAAPQFVNLFQSGGANALPYVYMNNSANALSVYDASDVMVEKALIITNGGYLAVDVRGNSDFSIGDLNTSTTQSNANPANVSTSGIYSNFAGALCVRNYGLIALSLIDNCRANVGSMFAKHPLHGDPSTNNSITSTDIETVRANHNSNIRLGGVYSVGVPGNTTVGTALFTSRVGNLYGTHNGASEAFVHAKNGSNIMMYIVGDPEGIFAFDGGTADFKIPISGSPPKYNITKALGDGTVHLYSALATSTTTSWADSTVKTRVVHDTRSPTTILTRSSNFLYNRATPGNRAWKGAFPTSPGFTTSGLNIGNADGSQPTSAAGLTYTSIVSNYGKTILGS